MGIILDLLLTIFAYMIFPFIFFTKNKFKYTKKKIYIINFLNSIVVMVFFIILRDILKVEETHNAGPAFLYWFINNALYYRYAISEDVENFKKEKKNEKIKNNKIKNKLTKNHFIYKTIVLLILSISLICNLVLGIKYLDSKKVIKEKEIIIQEKIEKFNNIAKDLYQIQNGKSVDYIKSKLNFFDNNVVFVIKGYGNYYYDYDCMIKSVGNNRYSYLAYNTEAALSQGYKKYTCSSGIKTYKEYKIEECRKNGGTYNFDSDECIK